MKLRAVLLAAFWLAAFGPLDSGGRGDPSRADASRADASRADASRADAGPGDAAMAGPAAPGWAAYTSAEFTRAVRLWTQAAAVGDPESAFALGLAYDLGRGVAMDPQAACRWYRSAGAAGHVAAMFNAAVMYDTGRCGPRQATLAALWYARAAASGHARAQFDVAQLYAAGDGVPRNPDQAAAWYRLAAANGLTAAADRVHSAPFLDKGPLRPVTPLGPAPEEPALRPAAGAATVPVVLAWAAPAQPEPVRFFVEVMALAPDGPHEVAARYIATSALQVDVPVGRRYAWRVLTVSAGAPHYVAAPWQLGPQGVPPTTDATQTGAP